MEWVRGQEIGRGGFATIYRAKPTNPSQLPPLIAVKSSESQYSATLRNEKQILGEIGPCPQIIRCFGDDQTVEDGEKFYNLVLEYATGGTLEDEIKRHGGRLPESDVRRHAKSVLKGLEFVHSRGFVHCDVKPQNVLIFDNGEAKIADFGLSKKAGEKDTKVEVRGTPLYMAPESVNDNEYGSGSDIWALGCLVAEMASGKPVWDHNPGANIFKLLMRIGGDDESPEIPEELGEEGKDFVLKCFVKDPRDRWTANMLLKHPFVDSGDESLWSEFDCEEEELSPASPRSPFNFPDWVSTDETSGLYSPGRKSSVTAAEETANWSFSGDWVTVV